MKEYNPSNPPYQTPEIGVQGGIMLANIRVVNKSPEKHSTGINGFFLALLGLF